MSRAPGSGDAAGVHVRRVDDRLGLAVLRVGLSGRTLVTYARDHVTVRTPSRPDFADGNTLDIVAPPAPSDIADWVARFGSTIAVMGAAHVRVRWEGAVGASVPEELADACAREGLSLSTRRVALLDRLPETPVSDDLELSEVAAPSLQQGAANDRRWHAATVLYRYALGRGPEDYRAYDEAASRWSVDVQRELASAQRARVWVAVRHGVPVARCTVTHDRQGLAAVQDVITHPVHRGRGVATALVERAVRRHLAQDPGARVGIAHHPETPQQRFVSGLGFRWHATVFTAHRG